MSATEKPKRSLLDRFYFILFVKVAPIITFVIGVYYALGTLRLSADTTTITNTALGIVGSFSALSFSAARAIEATDEHRKEFTRSGELFLFASILLLSASLIKYATLSAVGFFDIRLDHIPAWGLGEWLQFWVFHIARIIVTALFLVATMLVFQGGSRLNETLWKRLYEAGNRGASLNYRFRD